MEQKCHQNVNGLSRDSRQHLGFAEPGSKFFHFVVFEGKKKNTLYRTGGTDEKLTK